MLRFIEGIPDVFIIHLTRKDKFRTLVSWKIALLTGVWGVKKGHPLIPREKKMITITPEEALKFLSDITNYESLIEQRFNNNHYLHITYEQLVNNPEASMDAIFKLLNVPPHVADTKYIRSNPEPLQELVINFQELVDTGIVEKFNANE